jgi:L-aspartate oxidase
LEGLVFGYRIAEKLRQNLPEAPAACHDLQIFIEQETVEERTELDRRELQATVTEHMGIVRTGEGLQKAHEFLERTAQPVADTPIIANPSYIELQNLRTVASLMTKAAQIRTESRGSHFRLDFPEKSEAWHKKIILQNGQVSYIPVPDSNQSR